MKLSLISVSALSLSVFAFACSTDTQGDKLQQEAPAPASPVEPPPPAPTPRTLVEGTALPTSPVNLITDPGFQLLGDQAGVGSFLAFDEASSTPLTLVAVIDSRGPAGFAGGVGLVRPDGATSKASAPVLVLTSFQGGAGPFHAKVWVSKSDLSGRPADVSVDDKGIRASVTDETPDGEAFDLTPVAGSARVIGGRTWTLLKGEITKGLTYGGFFVVRTGTGGGQYHVAAPEIVAQPLLDGLAATRSRSSSSLPARAKTKGEASAILRYKDRLPRLVPASSRVTRAD